MIKGNELIYSSMTVTGDSELERVCNADSLKYWDHKRGVLDFYLTKSFIFCTLFLCFLTFSKNRKKLNENLILLKLTWSSTFSKLLSYTKITLSIILDISIFSKEGLKEKLICFGFFIVRLFSASFTSLDKNIQRAKF